MLSPHNLELDSDTSSVAAWSFSMATPTTIQPGDRDKEAPPTNMEVCSFTTSTDEDSPSESEKEEGISSGDDSVLSLLGKPRVARGKTLLKIKDKVVMKNKVCSDITLKVVEQCSL